MNALLKRGEDGQPLVVRTVLFDASERLAYERELMAARRRAEESEARARVLAETLQRSFLPPDHHHRARPGRRRRLPSGWRRQRGRRRLLRRVPDRPADVGRRAGRRVRQGRVGRGRDRAGPLHRPGRSAARFLARRGAGGLASSPAHLLPGDLLHGTVPAAGPGAGRPPPDDGHRGPPAAAVPPRRRQHRDARASRPLPGHGGDPQRQRVRGRAEPGRHWWCSTPTG